MTVENQSDRNASEQTLGEDGTVVLHNVSFDTLSLENASAQGSPSEHPTRKPVRKCSTRPRG